MKKVNAPIIPRIIRTSVADLHAALVFLGYSIDEREQSQLRFGASTRAAVISFQTAQGLRANGRVDEVTAAEFNTLLAEKNAFDQSLGNNDASPSDDELFTIAGEVVKPDGTPLPNHVVRAYDRALCEWRLLGNEDAKISTDDLGRYRITYESAQLKSWGKSRADLKVELRDPTGDTVLAESPLILQARPHETVNFSVGDQAYRGPDEFSRVELALSPLLESHDRDLSCVEVGDVFILAREAGIRATQAAYYVKARRWSENYGARVEIFYALQRVEESRQIDALLARPLAGLWASLERARRKNIVDIPLTDKTHGELEQVQLGFLTNPDHPYGKLLDTTQLKEEQRKLFTQRLTSGDLSGEAFWLALEEDKEFGADSVDDLQQTFELQALVADNPSLTLRLRGELGLKSARETASFSMEHWRDEVLASDTVAIPEDVLPGGQPEERRAAYAQQLYRVAERRYPTTSLAAQMTRDSTWQANALPELLTAMPQFDFQSQRLFSLLKDQPGALDRFADPTAARQELLRVEQLFHLVPAEDRLATIQPLWAGGLRSAPQLAALGRSTLRRQAGTAIDRRVLDQIYRNAVQASALALNTYLQYAPQNSSHSLPVLQVSQIPAEDLPAEWASMFGSADACECSHCESALSPAAYLVDQMAFLERAVDTAGNNALDELLRRRPDLGSLQLNCDNTETPLPHIDLVIEILEAIVASPDGKTLSADAIGATTWQHDLLEAQPQYLEPAAYDVLQQAVYPFDRLPFDLWTEEGRRYLRQMGITRDTLMRVMPDHAGVGPLEIATDALGMTSLERELIRHGDTRIAAIAGSWGISASSSTINSQLGRVVTLSDQAQIDYDTLVRLLNTRYINAEAGVSVKFAGTPCSLEAAVLVNGRGAELINLPLRTFLDRLHRFMRLQRRLACTEYELDSLIHQLDLTDFNAASCFENLADLQALRDSLKLPLLELTSWWGDLDTYAFEDDLSSQYETVFLDDRLFAAVHTGTGPDLRNEVFALRADRLDLAITVSNDPSLSQWLAEAPELIVDADYGAHIQSATRLTANELQLLVSDWLPKESASGHVALNLSNLSALYRMASLRRIFKISVEDALSLIALTGLPPISTPLVAVEPDQSRRFYEQWVNIKAGSHSIPALTYLLRHESGAVNELAPLPEDIDAWLETMVPSFGGIVAIEGSPVESTVSPELQSLVAESAAAAVETDATLLEALLFDHRPELGTELLAQLIVAANPDARDLPAVESDFYDVFIRLHKFAVAWNGLELDASLLGFIVEMDKGPALGWTDIAALPVAETGETLFHGWSRLTHAAALHNTTFTQEQPLFTLLEDAAEMTETQANDPASFVLSDYLAELAAWTAWPLEDLTYLTGSKGFNLELPTAMQDERALVDLQKIFLLILHRGVTAEQAHAWTVAELGFSETQAIKQILSLAYTPESWLDVLGTLQDPLRTLKRDALLGYLLNSLDMPDSDAFYAHYLIDAAAAPCGQTSRIVSAHMALQLFVQRILFRLEPFNFEQADVEAWRWRENYRVWEAARKVFLWAENWLRPELRDNKSQFFMELEDALMQEEVTSESAERLCIDYLSKLDQVARLEILGLYEDKWTEHDREFSILHVIGRTREVPASHFYRRLENDLRWTPWQRIDLDSGSDHLVPVSYNGKLYLFWPEFTVTDTEDPATNTEEKNDRLELLDEIEALQQEIDVTNKQLAEIPSDLSRLDELPGLVEKLAELTADLQDKQDQLDAIGTTTDSANVEETLRYDIELGMAWVTLGAGGSSPKYLSREKLIYQSNVQPEYHHFVGWVSGESLLRIAVSTSHTTNPDVGYFYFDDAHGELFASTNITDPPPGSVGAFGGGLKFQALKLLYFYGEEPRLELEVDSYLPNLDSRTNSMPIKATGAAARDLSGQTDFSLDTATQFDAPYTHPRPLLTRLLDGGGQIQYLHQYGLGGNSESSFFFSTNERCYFVQVQDAWDPSNVHMASSAALSPQGSASVSRSTGAFTEDTHFNVNDAGILYGAFGGVESDALNAEAGLVQQILTPDQAPAIVVGKEVLNTSLGYRYTRFYDPYTSVFLRQASRHGIDGLLSPDSSWDEDSANLYRQLMPNESFSFEDTYAPDVTWVDPPYPKQEIDFDHDSPCGWSNWEVFFHIPLLVATRLMENQRFAEARDWLHHIFDPTCDDGSGPERFWKIRPFYEAQSGGPIDELDSLLSEGSPSYEEQVKAWSLDPFAPDVIARMRKSTYMMKVVMLYLDCLLQEADLYFSLDTREHINKAQLLYMLASEILGDRPTLLPPQDQSVLTPEIVLGRFRDDWNGPDGRNLLDPLAAALSTTLPGAPSARSSTGFAAGPMPVDPRLGGQAKGTALLSAQSGTGIVDTLLLFCIPPNEKLYDYWNTVADRLYKIRHCMNLSGQVRQLALFSPPIDPALLVRANAAGLSIQSVLSSLYGPGSPYRFNFLLQKALELCSEVRNLGGALLSALEKQDSEALSLLRSTHELGLLEAIRTTKERHVEEAEAALAALEKSRDSARFREAYYSSLERVSRGEQASLQLQDKARFWQMLAELTDSAASFAHFYVPNFSMPLGPGVPSVSYGGSNIGAAGQSAATALRSASTAIAHQANRAGITASYTRRSRDWQLQADLAQREVEQLDAQILAAEIRHKIAEDDLAHHDKQIEQAAQVEDFLKLKFTNQQLYSWTVSRLASVHFQTYQLASQLALQAESAFQYELGPEEQSASFISLDNWDSLRKGLTAGELLHQQLRQMENAYLAANLRELEITKAVSLFQLDPAALLSLRATGSCEFHVPEVWYDLNFAGHYFRRIKAVRITIPCIVGPYANVSATLSLTDSWTRRTTDITDADQPENDSATVSQNAIATSSASQDGGLFELNFNDPRYLPFEGAGAVSSWRLELPSTIRPFDYATISDVVAHISYTARDGGPNLKTEVNAGLLSAINQLKAPNAGGTMSRLISLRHDFPAAWAQLFSAEDNAAQGCSLQLSKQDFPAFLDFAWLPSEESGKPDEPAKISLSVVSLLAFLSPNGMLPADAFAVTLNQQMATDSDLGMPMFDLTAAPDALSESVIDNTNSVDCQLAVDGVTMLAETWNDIYLLLDYEITI